MPFLLLIWGFIKPYALYIALGLAAILTVLAVLARVKNAGRVQERLEQQQAILRSQQDMTRIILNAPTDKAGIINSIEKEGL